MNYLDQYEDFLLKNASQITGIEASLRSLTYILPGNHPYIKTLQSTISLNLLFHVGRFHDAEFASQASRCLVNGRFIRFV